MSVINRARLRLQLREWMDALLEVQEAEREAHRLFCDANSNLAYGRLSREMRDGYVKQTYKATGLHADAIDELKRVQNEISKLIGAINEPEGGER